jgi:hypothetical protein
MSSKFKQLTRAFARSAISPRNRGKLREARSRHALLAQFGSTMEYLAFMKLQTPALYPERDQLTRVAIAERQRSGDDYWSELLALAYYPMLSRLRFRIWGQPLPDEDLDQLVLMTFFRVVDRFPLDRWRDRTALRLRQRTSRDVFEELERVQRRASIFVDADEHEDECVVDPTSDDAGACANLRLGLHAAAARVRHLLAGAFDDDEVEGIVETTVFAQGPPCVDAETRARRTRAATLLHARATAAGDTVVRSLVEARHRGAVRVRRPARTAT